MVRFWLWSRVSNQRAVGNARAAATELSRQRIERDDVAIFLAQLEERRTLGPRTA